MLGSKVTLFAVLLLAADVLATRVVYSGRYDDNGKTASTKKLTELDDDKADKVKDNVKDWSDGKFDASKHHLTGILTVFNTANAASKGAASQLVQDMQSLVNKKADD
jgi:hypothetical protein